MAKTKAKSKVQVEAEKAHAEAREQLDNDELARRHIEAQKAQEKAVQEQLEKEEAAKKERAAIGQAQSPEEELTPLTPQEQEELARLEEKANRGTFQPFPTEMIRLGKLRQRAKL